MKTAILLTICSLFQLISLAQKIEEYEFDIVTKFGSKITIEVGVTYDGATKIQELDSIINYINIVLTDSLQQFDLIEMYFPKRFEMQKIIDRTFKREFEKLNLDVDQAVLRELIFPKEAKILINRFFELEMNYYKVLIIVDDRINEINTILKSNLGLSEKEKSELEIELNVLENHQYLRKIYDEQIFKVLNHGLTEPKKE